MGECYRIGSNGRMLPDRIELLRTPSVDSRDHIDAAIAKMLLPLSLNITLFDFRDARLTIRLIQ
jgi:hypothetical protein